MRVPLVLPTRREIVDVEVLRHLTVECSERARLEIGWALGIRPQLCVEPGVVTVNALRVRLQPPIQLGKAQPELCSLYCRESPRHILGVKGRRRAVDEGFSILHRQGGHPGLMQLDDLGRNPAQQHYTHHAAGGSRMQSFKAAAESTVVVVNQRSKGLFYLVALAGVGIDGALEVDPGLGREVLQESVVLGQAELVGVGEDVAAERAKPEMDRTPQPARVGAAPVHHEIGVDDRIARAQLGRDPALERRSRIEQELFALGLGARLFVAARQNPENAVLVKGDVPLHVPGGVLHQVLLHAAQRSLLRRAGVAMPVGVAGVDQAAADRPEGRHRRYWR